MADAHTNPDDAELRDRVRRILNDASDDERTRAAVKILMGRWLNEDYNGEVRRQAISEVMAIQERWKDRDWSDELIQQIEADATEMAEESEEEWTKKWDERDEAARRLIDLEVWHRRTSFSD